MKSFISKLTACALALTLLTACSARPETGLPAPEYASPSPAPTPSATPSPTPEPTPQDEYFVISMCGDCTLSSSQRENTFEYIVDGDMAYPFSGVKQFFEDDYLTIANLECSLSPEPLYGSSTFQFCGDAENAQMLIEGSVEFVTLGNNHTMDFGQKGLDNTTATLDEYGIDYAVPDGSFVYQSGDGPSIGLYAAPWCATEAQVRAGVSALAAREDVDLVVCLMHWGMEGYYRPWGSQTSLGRAAVDSGADIVYGSHPHVLQSIEEYNGAYIIYSLGNFVFGGNTNPRDKDTAIVQFTIKRAASGEVTVEGMEKIPCSLTSTAGMNDFRPEPYEEGTEEYERAMSKLDGTFTGPNLVIDYSEYHESPSPSPAEGGSEDES